jgi:hypothetical protein
MPYLLDPKNDYAFKRLFAEAPDLLVVIAFRALTGGAADERT